MDNIEIAIKRVGIPEVAKACGVSERAVYKWLKNGFLPKTEFFGKTSYAETIEEVSDGEYLAVDLLRISRERLLSHGIGNTTAPAA
ncbi:helix-turn-helix domain-containing protein [Serratia liquefaciens]|uniref:helix-turn-helix domain-containing protein n=1 Tax=Serratia liquefaciens TaxID=614 RepID=UPI001F4865AE|nr:helix-turn-helix domain-containing protein [Serratia liquefaciens]MCE9938560.1 helix-turn-helix domain-containing protein [Serratia liquefaciens]